MAKRVEVVSSRNDEPTDPARFEESKDIDWKLCILCRTESNENLVCPANSKSKDVGAGYELLGLSLSQPEQLDVKPFDIEFCELDNGESIASTFSIDQACWHKSC